MGESNRSSRKQKIQIKVAALMSGQFLAAWRSSLEDMCGGDGVVVKNLYSMFMFESLHNLHLGVSKLLKLFLAQYLSSHETCGHLRGPAGRQKSLSLVRLSLLKSCSDILSHIEEKYSALGLHVNFSKKADSTAERSHYRRRI